MPENGLLLPGGKEQVRRDRGREYVFDGLAADLLAVICGAETVRGRDQPPAVEHAAPAPSWGQLLALSQRQLRARLALLLQRADLEVRHPGTVLGLVAGDDADAAVCQRRCKQS